MTPLEAMTRLISVADTQMSMTRNMAELSELSTEQRTELEDTEVAISIIQAMLNTALPIARFRCFVEVDALSKKRGGLIRDDYTICSPNIHGVMAGLIGLGQVRTEVHATLWEQRADGASMLSGYQGPSKSSRYRSWLGELVFSYEEKPEDVKPS